jgi:general secretion pathway protein H
MLARHHLARQRGMTLIEILIVIGVFSLMVGMVAVGFGAGQNAETTRAVNQMANTIRYGFDKARVTGDYYRVLIDLDASTVVLQEGDDRMYLPATDRNGEVVEVDVRRLQEQADRDARAEEAYNRSIQSAVYENAEATGGEVSELDVYKPQPRKVPRRKPPLFDAFEEENALSGMTKPVKLPEGVRINYVRTAEDLEPITKGQAAIFFFPGGRTQLAHIQLQDESGENRYTIKVQPLTGRVTIEDGHEDLELKSDAANEEEDELGRKQEKRVF